MKGLVLQLSAEAAQSLRLGSQNQQQQQHQDGEHDDWNDVIPLGPSSSSSPQQQAAAKPRTTASNEEGEEIENGDNGDYDDDDESFMSRTPPASMPALLIDLERLVGYAPTTNDEAARLLDDVTAALGSTGDAAFEGRVAQLLDANLARHTTTATTTNASTTASQGDTDPLDSSSTSTSSSSLRYANLPYPPAMILVDKNNTIVTTARLWKRVIKPYGSDVPVVNRLLDRIVHCSRPLTWKASMRREVVNLANREMMRMEMHEHEFHRSDQLHKLYGVRDVIENQLNVTAVRVEELERDRDELVRQRLALSRMDGDGGGGDATGLAFDIFNGGDEGDDDVEADEVALSTDYGYDAMESEDSDDYHSHSEGSTEEANVVSDVDGESELEESPSQESTMESTQGSSASEKVNHMAPRRRRRRRTDHHSREARRQREQQEKAEAEAARYRRERDAMQQACTTPELASLQAVLQALEQKLQQVDELLETLQEEEWKKEEEREGSDDDDSSDDGVSDPVHQQKQLSLLDEILAMVLGTTRPPLDNTSLEDHVAWMRNEHREIVKEWKDHFGRVPPPLRRDDQHGASSSRGADSTETAVSPTFVSTGESNHDQSTEFDAKEQDQHAMKDQLKQAFGIEDNDVDNWEEVEGDELQGREETVKALRPQRGRRSRR